jgi:hypothetical protein
LSEETLHAFEDVGKGVLTGANGLSCLKDLGRTIVREQESRKILTERKTPMPTKMTFAGDKT